MGAVAIKSSVYALPESEPAAEHFQWLVREIGAAGGEASVCEAQFVEGLTDGQIEALFRVARESEYSAVASEAEELLRGAPTGRGLEGQARAELEAALSRLRRRMAEIGSIDFFGTPARETAEAALQRMERRVRPLAKVRPARSAARVRKPGQTWVTRRGVYIDRIASAWLIRRFIDRSARFRFVEERGYRPAPHEVRFDMFEAEYTHEGERCTFEVLLARFGLEEPGLQAVAEMVHDIDLRDGKFVRPEAPGLERVIAGIARRHAKDQERVAQGSAVLDALYDALR
jgi:hypothetical protein